MSVAPPLTNGTTPSRATPTGAAFPSLPLVALTAADDPPIERPIPPRPDPVRAPAPAPSGSAGYGPFLPLLLLAAAVVGWSGFQTYELTREREQLATARDAQQPQVDAAIRIRANLDALAASTQRLANAGNANARTVVEALRRRGVNINPNPVATAPAAGK